MTEIGAFDFFAGSQAIRSVAGLPHLSAYILLLFALLGYVLDVLSTRWEWGEHSSRFTSFKALGRFRGKQPFIFSCC
jgi:hypothetical protein